MEKSEIFAKAMAAGALVAMPVGAMFISGLPNFGEPLTWLGSVMFITGAWVAYSTSKNLEN